MPVILEDEEISLEFNFEEMGLNTGDIILFSSHQSLVSASSLIFGQNQIMYMLVLLLKML